MTNNLFEILDLDGTHADRALGTPAATTKPLLIKSEESTPIVTPVTTPVVISPAITQPPIPLPTRSTVSLNMDEMQNCLRLPATKPSYTFANLQKGIKTIETALHGTDWKRALDEATRLCFTILMIAFIMARHAHPLFPSLPDWGVIARMRTPLLRDDCLYENTTRKSGEPFWHSSCFIDGQLMLGTDGDSHTLYIKNANNTWTRLQMDVSPEVQKVIEQRIQRIQKDGADATAIDNKIWDLTIR